VVTVLIDTAESLTCLDRIGSLFGGKSPVQAWCVLFRQSLFEFSRVLAKETFEVEENQVALPVSPSAHCMLLWRRLSTRPLIALEPFASALLLVSCCPYAWPIEHHCHLIRLLEENQPIHPCHGSQRRRSPDVLNLNSKRNMAFSPTTINIDASVPRSEHSHARILNTDEHTTRVPRAPRTCCLQRDAGR